MIMSNEIDLKKLKPRDLLPLWAGFAPTVSRELPFAIAKFLTFDLITTTVVAWLNVQASQDGSLPVQVGVGPIGLALSAFAGAFAGIAGAFVSHPADLILTKTSATKKSNLIIETTSESSTKENKKDPAWITVVKDLVNQDGGIANLFVGLGARSVFFFLVIGLQFFLYDYVKNLFQVGSDDLSLVLDVFYAVRAGLVGIET
jgi:Mitochondrial carrier protein